MGNAPQSDPNISDLNAWFKQLLDVDDFDGIKCRIQTTPYNLLLTLNTEIIIRAAKWLLESGDQKNANLLLRINETKSNNNILKLDGHLEYYKQCSEDLEESRQKVHKDIDYFVLIANIDVVNENYDNAFELYTKAIDRAERSAYPNDKYIQILERFLKLLKKLKDPKAQIIENIEEKLQKAKRADQLEN